MNITLYAAPWSSAIPVVNALVELDAPHELIWLDLEAGDQKKPAFLALNPNGKVPTLVVDGTPMFEALAIVQWLGDRFGVERKLWPAPDAPERLEALSWTTWAYVTLGSHITRLNYAQNERAPAELRSEAHARHSQAEIQQLLAILDARLASRPYLLGADFSLADLVVASCVTYATHCKVAVDDHAHVKAWLARFHARPAYQKAWAAAAA